MSESPARPTDPDLERRWSVVEAKLAANADRLADQGSLVTMKSASGRRVRALRFVDRVDGRRVQRSLYVGGDDQSELLRRTQIWLDGCRVKGRVATEVTGHARLAAAVCGAVRRLHPSLVPKRR